MKIDYANQSDIWDILSWRNDEVSILNSLSGAPIAPDEHEFWFSNLLSLEEMPIIIGSIENNKVGFARYDKRDNFYVSSICLNPAMRGKGLSKTLLSLSENFFFQNKSDILCIAQILKSNLQSIKLFEACGYKFREKSDLYSTYEKVIDSV